MSDKIARILSVALLTSGATWRRMSAVVVKVAQSVRALDCGSRGRGFDSRLSPFFMRGGDGYRRWRDEFAG